MFLCCIQEMFYFFCDVFLTGLVMFLTITLKYFYLALLVLSWCVSESLYSIDLALVSFQRFFLAHIGLRGSEEQAQLFRETWKVSKTKQCHSLTPWYSFSCRFLILKQPKSPGGCLIIQESPESLGQKLT